MSQCHLFSHFVIEDIIIDLLIFVICGYRIHLWEGGEMGNSTNKSDLIKAVYNIKFHCFKLVQIFLFLIWPLKSLHSLYHHCSQGTHNYHPMPGNTRSVDWLYFSEHICSFYTPCSCSCCSFTFLPCLANPSWLLRFR